MEFAYRPPKALEHLAPNTAARTQLGWGIGDDGSVDLEHIMSANPFAGKTRNWGIAEYADGDIVIQSKGPGDSASEEQIPPELIQKIVEFYEKEGLNVRNIHEKTALGPGLVPDVPSEGMCPQCHSKEVYGVPGSPYVDCESCGWHGDESEVLDASVDPDPDAMNSDLHYNDDFIADASTKTAGVTLKGATIVAGAATSGVVIRPDIQNEQQALQTVQENAGATPDQNLRQYVDVRNQGDGTSFPAYDNPYVNRGGSLISEKIEDHFIEEQPHPKVAADPIGIPQSGPSDLRNFETPGGTIVVAKNLITDHSWAFLGREFNCVGLVTEMGGSGSHAAVVATGHGIPLIAGIPVDQIQPGDHLTMDPATGSVAINGGGEEIAGDTEAKHEAVRFVWANGHHLETPWGDAASRLHMDMILEMLTNGEAHENAAGDGIENGTRGVIYTNGEGEYYDPITDADTMEAFYKQQFPQLKSMEFRPSVGYNVAAKVAVSAQDEEFDPSLIPDDHLLKEGEITDSAPKCPNCDSHSYRPITLPSKTEGKGMAELQCLNCGETYKHEVYRNPKKSEVQEPTEEELASDDPPEWFVAELNRQLEASLKVATSECDRCGHSIMDHEGMDGDCDVKGCTCDRFEPQGRRSSIQKGAPYPENSDKNAPDHSPKGQDWPKKVNSIYNACMREGNGSGDSKDEKESSCAAIAWAQYKKMKKSSLEKEADEWDKSYDSIRRQKPNDHFPGVMTFPKIDETQAEAALRKAFQLGSIDAADFERAIGILYSKGVEGLVDAHEVGQKNLFMVIWNAINAPEKAPHYVGKVSDTDGNPLEAGKLYLMHSVKYKIPDIVQLVKVEPNGIEAHIESDATGAFPIQITHDQFDSEGYSFEPYGAPETPAVEHSGKLSAKRRIVVDNVRQRELINENPGGRARNYEKLNLEGTHYLDDNSYEIITLDDLADHFL